MRIKSRKRLYGIFLTWGLSLPVILLSQNYQAIHGSSQAGGLGAANNPSSILHVPFSWDFTLFAVQEKHSTNALYLSDYSLISPGKDSEVKGVNGTRRPFAYANQDVHLFNTRIRLDPKNAIAFGANIRSYVYTKISRTTFQDTARELEQIMFINKDNIPVNAELTANAWAEVFATYARNIIDDPNKILNAGVTINITRGLGAAYMKANNLGFSPDPVPAPGGGHRFILNDVTLQYGYSGNIDDMDKASKGGKRAAFLRRTQSSVSLSAGIEYITPVIKTGDEENAYQYDLKIGVSLLDIGFNNYKYSDNSRSLVIDGRNIPDSVLEAKFDNIGSIERLNDTLATLASSIAIPSGAFKVFQPARLVVNVDKNIIGDLYVNGELTIPLSPLLGPTRLFAKELNLFALTPRIETKTLGVYLPFTINTRGQAWLGAAAKAGPLLVGFHNLANIFASNKMQEGGFYMALIFRPGRKGDLSRIKKPKLSRLERRQLSCPVIR